MIYRPRTMAPTPANRVITTATKGPMPSSTRAPAAPELVAEWDAPLDDTVLDTLAVVVDLRTPLVVPVLAPLDVPVAVPVDVPEGLAALTVAAAAKRSVEAKVWQLDDAGVLTEGSEVTTAGCE